MPEFYLICYKNLIWSNFHSSENLLDLPWDDVFMVFGIDNSFIIFGWIFTYWPCSVNFVVAWWHSWAIGIKTSVESRRVIKHRGMRSPFLLKKTSLKTQNKILEYFLMWLDNSYHIYKPQSLKKQFETKMQLMHRVFGAHEKHSTESIALLFFLTAFPFHSVEIWQKKMKNLHW